MDIQEFIKEYTKILEVFYKVLLQQFQRTSIVYRAAPKGKHFYINITAEGGEKNMEVYERKDFIQIDYKDKRFQTVIVTESYSLPDVENEHVRFEVMQQFGENLEECIKFTIGAMSAVNLFKESVYRPVDFVEVVFTKKAKQRILSKRDRIAEIWYPDLKVLKGVWKKWLH